LFQKFKSTKRLRQDLSQVEEFLDHIVDSIPGLECIRISDKDGVTILRAPGSIIEHHQANQILTLIFSVTTEQTNRMQELGEAEYVCTTFEKQIIVQYNLAPLCITLVAKREAKVGVLVQALPMIAKALTKVREVVRAEMEEPRV
jgi:predicted regulator of Ras-like GTPase activity (Roadblock/LC7/MglB family)